MRKTKPGAGSRNKGKAGEREVINLLQPVVTEVYEAFDRDAPLLQRNTLACDAGGFDVVGLEWLALEIKNHATGYQKAWWEQCLAQAGHATVPVLFYRRANVSQDERWQVRMFCKLCEGLIVPCTISSASFLAWFRIRLSQELSK